MKTPRYLSANEVAVMWGITKRRVQNLCVNNRIPGAFRLGNMWAIPSDALKPKDARVRNPLEKELVSTSELIRKARRAIKSIVERSIDDLRNDGMNPIEMLHTVVVLFAASLLENLGIDHSLCLKKSEKFFNYDISTTIPHRIIANINRYILENSICLDDALSWVYQFTTKTSPKEFKYSDTQFFTEKYMISTLVDSLHVDDDSKVLDPACGGGNFLVYTFDIVVKNTDNTDAFERASLALNKLLGYEIDSLLSYVCAFNLKFKALSYVKEQRQVTIEDFDNLHPQVFHPIFDTVSGFLDNELAKQYVINCDNGDEIKLADAINGVNTIVTNPPFRTIKGMPIEQKEFLQKHYPMAKCDMCNAFIEKIMNVLPIEGKAAMVTQNSWMYLKSFNTLRSKLLMEYTFDSIWELGSNAFYDLSGEKANIALVNATKAKPDKTHKIELILLRNTEIAHIEESIERGTIEINHIKQQEVLTCSESRFDMVSSYHLKELKEKCDQYKMFATPMQGTSTGDAKNLIDYYWRHIGDADWVLVSKGGGYSRFEGLNSYCVKWGKNGEYIKNTKGSAIRNANYSKRI